MLIKNRIIRDTLLLTVMQLCLDTASLFLNSYITHHLGASAMGILVLTGSFLGFAGILSNGNAFLCTSRLISEELGKRNGSPERVLFHGIKLCIMMSVSVSIIIIIFSEKISSSFFSGADISQAIRFMPAALIAGALSSCFKGYFNAVRKPAICAIGDTGEFLIRSGTIVLSALRVVSHTEGTICNMMIRGIIAGNVFSLIFFGTAYFFCHNKNDNRCSLTFIQYAGFAFPIMGGGIMTTALSSTNDALIPICLRQSGDSVSEALSSFGIFEAIVIPALFFPSVILCSASGIIVSEAARTSASGNKERIKRLTEVITSGTMIYAVFVSAVLIRFGRVIGEMLGGGELAGDIIVHTAPVVPFIYMEIVLEALIKGTGQQAFSSLNYLAEYIIRISSVLIFVPMLGFTGIVISYYASNMIGNTSRFIRLLKTTRMKFRPVRQIGIPVLYVFLTMNLCQLIFPRSSSGMNIPSAISFVFIWGVLYLIMMCLLGKFKSLHMDTKLSVVQDAQ